MGDSIGISHFAAAAVFQRLASLCDLDTGLVKLNTNYTSTRLASRPSIHNLRIMADMGDLIFVAATVMFFAASAAFIFGLNRI
jgi:hypothetical protein